MPVEPIYRVAEIRALEHAARADDLMERAGLAAAEIARSMLDGRTPRVVVLAGPGNNGGDGFVAARWLKQWFFDVDVAFAADASRLPRDARAAHNAWRRAGGTTLDAPAPLVHAGLVIDALFGIGLRRAIGEPYASWIESANAGRAPILALDVPSGRDADTGVANGPAIDAAATVTFIAAKPGLFTGDGADAAGRVHVASLGIDAPSLVPPQGHFVRWSGLRDALPDALQRRRRNVNKGTFGTLAVIGGASGMTGAAILASRAALDAGAGKIWTGFLADAHPLVDALYPELMLRDASRALRGAPDAIVLGPGMGTDHRAAECLREALALDVPVIVDADALTLIAGDAALASDVAARACGTVLTPHPGEAARLLACDIGAVQSDRVRAALAIAKQYRSSVVLKGAGSVIAHADGTWAIASDGNCGLASAGAGDVLSGIVGAFLAQGIEAARALELAVALHGAAADALLEAGEGPIGMRASLVVTAAKRLLNATRRDALR